MTKTYYEKRPIINLNLDFEYAEFPNDNTLIIETYPGYRHEEVINFLKKNNFDGDVICSEDFSKYTKESFRENILDDLTEDRVFGRFTIKSYKTFFDLDKIEKFSKETKRPIAIFGIGAYLFKDFFPKAKVLYVDLPRWEIQKRYRSKEGVYFKGGIENDVLKNFKRGYFIEWRMADNIKKFLWNNKLLDYWVDGSTISFNIFNFEKICNSLTECSKRPFRLLPYFDAGVWGGKWMQNKFSLGENIHSKWAWGFDGVPEENSLLFKTKNGITFEMPAINLVFFESKNLLGERVWNRFGEEFPIRFDFLDTIGGENLSLQVHPTTQYMKDTFGGNYTQEESYYILDVEEKSNPSCYLGLKDGVTKVEIFNALEESKITNKFDVEKFVNKFSVKKHDHLSHPAGCIHSSASGCMVLEISATPYIFTFKLWDWARLDFDGKPRPINLSHGKNVLQENFDTTRCKKECYSPFVTLEETKDYKKEKTGLHEIQFIETIRHTIGSSGAIIKNNGSVNMLNLVEGDRAVIESHNNAFQPFYVNYAETFIVPEYCKEYIVRPAGLEKNIMILQAFVRG